MLTKTDYLRYLEAPLHLWAEKHSWLDKATPSRYEQHLMEQGKAVEKLARAYLQDQVDQSGLPLEMSFQKTITDQNYQARLDAVVFDSKDQVYDIYEIKSTSSVRKEHLYDATFQRLVAEANFPVRHTFILHINKEYLQEGVLEIDKFFVSENVDEQTEALRNDLLADRQNAWQVANSDSPDGIAECLKPKDCPCPRLCHPGLPEYSIFDLPRLHHAKARELKSQGVLAIQDIPQDFPLSDRQTTQMQVVKSGHPKIDRDAIRDSLSQLRYPLYFLDYETFNPAIPQYDHYYPYQHIVFQYSMHIFHEEEEDLTHHEFLSASPGDPALPLLEHLLPRINHTGSVIVWNKSFEASRNREMARLYPQFAAQLENINARMYDLMETFSKGNYVHADFHGSASIKNILPVLVKDLSYEGLPISQGDEASIAWFEITKSNLSPEEIEQTKKDLLHYCALDTLAMVRNWQVLVQAIQ